MSRVPYVRIFVHKDVLLDAQEIVRTIDDHKLLPDEDVALLKDLVDPRPETDIYGHEPYIEEILLPDASKP